jgi:hypothetical protein
MFLSKVLKQSIYRENVIFDALETRSAEALILGKRYLNSALELEKLNGVVCNCIIINKVKEAY